MHHKFSPIFADSNGLLTYAADRIARSMIAIVIIMLSVVRLWRCASWLNDNPTAKVSEQMNSKCPPGNMTVQLSLIRHICCMMCRLTTTAGEQEA